MIKFVLLFLILGAPASAFNYCAEAWFTRNALFDRAGYCFGSNLGKAVFDNSNCTGTSPQLSAWAKDTVAMLKGEEDRIGCRIDTSRRTLDLPDLDRRLAMSVLPVPDPLGFGCNGWRGDVVPIFADARGGSRQIGTIKPGDNIGYSHITNHVSGGWDFISIYGGSSNVSGWVRMPDHNVETDCTSVAG